MITEDRLISANEALRMIQNSKTDDPCTDTIRRGVWAIAHDCAISCIDACPTVDAVEVVHGRLEWRGPYRYNGEGWIGTCSVCKERLRLFVHNYCPNCGAKMDLEESNNDD